MSVSATALHARLTAPGPKRLLALDGGGVRGVVALAFLEAVEQRLRERSAHGAAFRLAQHYDLIGGTSTGAIIAATLALGFTVAEVKALYFHLAPLVFRRRLRLSGVQAKFDSAALSRELKRVIGNRTLDSDDLKTGLAIICKRVDTGSPWVLTNNSASQYWNTPEDQSFIGNRHYLLRQVVRASTAAPYYFAPEKIAVSADAPPGLFIDGALSPHNDPSLQMFMLATMRGYGFCWPTGADALSLTSIGTGGYRPCLKEGKISGMSSFALAVNALQGLACDTKTLTMTLMQWFAEPATAWAINGEVGDLSGELIAGRPLLSYHRYDIQLEQAWLRREVGAEVGEKELKRLRALDRPESMAMLYALAAKSAAQQVTPQSLFM